MNFVECSTVEEANKINLKEYSFIGLKKNVYVFKVRQKSKEVMGKGF